MNRRLLVLTSLIVTVPLLGGWKFIEPKRAWDITDTGPNGTWPIAYYLGDAVPSGIATEEEKRISTQASYDYWRTEVACSPIEAVRAGEITNNSQGFGVAGITTLTYFDPMDNLGSGVLAAARSYVGNGVVNNNGVSFAGISESHIVYNDGVRFGTPDTISSPSCFSTSDFEWVSTHEIGHTLGLGHSCEQEEACGEPLLRGANMYWSIPGCSDTGRTPNEDDAAAINVAYGVSVDFEIEAVGEQELVGPTPLTASVTVPDAFQDNVTQYEWNFGDGSERVITTTAEEVEHTWEEEGQYTVTLTVVGEDDECGGEYTAQQRKVGAVLVCDEPRPSFEFVNEGEFTVAVQNTSDLGAFGCITDFVWILDGDEDSALRTYEPTYTFDGKESHSVTLRASGPGGDAEITATIEATKQSAEGCNASVAGQGSAGWLALLLLGGLLGLRRRD